MTVIFNNPVLKLVNAAAFCLWFQVGTLRYMAQNAFSQPFAAILVNCAPSGEMHNYCTPHIIKENFENLLIHWCNYILLSQVYCVWQVVKTLTVILNNPVFCGTPCSVPHCGACPPFLLRRHPHVFSVPLFPLTLIPSTYVRITIHYVLLPLTFKNRASYI